MNRSFILAAAAALAMGGAAADGFGFTGPAASRSFTGPGLKPTGPVGMKQKKKFKGSKAAKRAARRHK